MPCPPAAHGEPGEVDPIRVDGVVLLYELHHAQDVVLPDPVVTGDPVSKLRQKVGFHTSCSEPLFTGDQFGSLLLTGCEPDTTPALLEAPAAETQELEQESESEGTGETGQQPEDPQDAGAGQSQTPDVTVPDQAEGQPGPPVTSDPQPEPGEDEPTP